MKLLERFFTSRIDRALDNTKPLDFLTAWYVRHNSSLRSYYNAMLKMEIELRFSSDISSESNLSSIDFVKPLVKPKTPQRRWYRYAVAAGTAVFILVLLFLPLNRQRNKPLQMANTPPPQVEKKDNVKIDLDKLYTFAAPMAELLIEKNLFADIFASPLLTDFLPELPSEQIANFTEHPLDSALTFFETAGIVRTTPKTAAL